jgi:hypothetical protein
MAVAVSNPVTQAVVLASDLASEKEKDESN